MRLRLDDCGPGFTPYTAPATSPSEDVTFSSSFYREICWTAAHAEVSGGWPTSTGTIGRPYWGITWAAKAAFFDHLAGSRPTLRPRRPRPGTRSGTVDGRHTVELVSAPHGTGALAVIGEDPDPALRDAHGFTDSSITPDGRHAFCQNNGGRVPVAFQDLDGVRAPVVVVRRPTG